MTDQGRPSGPFSIGRALDIPSGSVNDDLRLAVDAIDRVHGAGLLPRIPMTFSGQLDAPGRFSYDPVTGTPIRILVSRTAPGPTFVAIHEIGHLLDLVVLGAGPHFGSAVNLQMDKWLSAVTSSLAYQTIAVQLAMAASSQMRRRLRAEELWARSYAQYISIRSESPVLLNALETLRTTGPGDLHNPLQWDDNDFDLIASAIDELFIGLGWRE